MRTKIQIDIEWLPHTDIKSHSCGATEPCAAWNEAVFDGFSTALDE